MSARDDQAPVKASNTSWSLFRSSSPTPGETQEVPSKPGLQQQKGADHVVTNLHRLSLKKYPRDCPPLRVQWFHAVDIPKRRPYPADEAKKVDKPPSTPKKYAAFSNKDSKAVEAAYQKLLDKDDSQSQHSLLQQRTGSLRESSQPRSDTKPNKSLAEDDTTAGRIKVPVNEDYLFDVDVERRELGPAYWLGPIYDVRRGTWFYQEGSIQKPCDENLASQLEEGYLKLKAWSLPTAPIRSRSTSQARSRAISSAHEPASKPAASNRESPRNPEFDLSNAANKSEGPRSRAEHELRPENTYRLFGAHMNSVVTYQDGITAWLSTDDFMSRMNYNVYQRFGGGGHFAGVKLTRGHVDAVKKPESKDVKLDDSKSTNAQTVEQKTLAPTKEREQRNSEEPRSPAENRRMNLERQMSYLFDDSNSGDPAKQDEEQRLRDEREIEDDYREVDGDDQGREVEHLILVTHGIGQRLGLRIDSVNFVHDVNTLRKSLKAVYADSPDLRALNAELDDSAKSNSRVQVLPICWRHLLDFPKQSLKHNRAEHDLGDSGFGEDDEDYPSLSDISVEGVPAVRNLITDLALDILLYQSPAYKDHISRIVLEECNRIYHLFVARNPSFQGRVSLIGHSLGSAIMFDILCRQDQPEATRPRTKSEHSLKLDFEVGDLYALGSPIGLFEMLRGRAIAARTPRPKTLSGSMDDPMFDAQASSSSKRFSSIGAPDVPTSDIQTSSPKCDQIFNIFHPTDPISYRLEPLISPAMASLKPQPLPYTKRGIFGAPVGQGLTGIGARVGQSVSSLWSSMSSGLASSLLTRGLGYTGEEPMGLAGQGGREPKSSTPLSLGAGANLTGAAMPPLTRVGTTQSTGAEEKSAESKQAQLASDALAAGAKGQHPPTLIDQEIETLSSGYEKRRQSLTSDSQTRDLGASHAADLAEIEERGKRLKREEAKVRKLNSNGRVDYAIQEGAFDINLLAAIASHLSYWGDEDVCHFMLSQLLSHTRVVKTKSARPKSGLGQPRHV